jgi:hypothetical protein
MKVQVSIPGGATSKTATARTLRESVSAAFEAEGSHVDSWSDFVPRGVLDDAFTTVVLTVALAPVGGIVWDAEKAAFRRALAGLRRVMVEHAVVGAVEMERPGHEPVEYLIPDGPEGDAALAALDADYATNPQSLHRDWWPGVGWIDGEEMLRRLEAGEIPPAGGSAPPAS